MPETGQVRSRGIFPGTVIMPRCRGLWPDPHFPASGRTPLYHTLSAAASIPAGTLFCPDDRPGVFAVDRFFDIAALVAVRDPDFPYIYRVF